MFADRTEAGRQLASKLREHARRADAVVLGISRGGLAVAREVARRLHLPLDAFVVRKLTVPEHKLLILGAVASGGIRVLDHAVFVVQIVFTTSSKTVGARSILPAPNAHQSSPGSLETSS